MNEIYELNQIRRPITLDLLVLNFNKFEEYGKNCIQSLIDQGLDDKTFLYVLDNNSTDGSKEKLRNFIQNHPQVNFIQSDKNLGFSGGMNLLAKNSSSHWLLLINNDTFFPSNTINQLKDILERVDEKIGAVGTLTNAAGNEQNINISGTFEEILKEGEKVVEKKLNLLFEVPRLDFFCVAIRRKVWDILNGLDEIYERGYYEDFDFCVRLKKSDYKLVITEDIFIYHKGSGSFSEDKKQKEIIKKNKEIFIKKYPNQKLYHVRENNLYMLYMYKRINNTSKKNLKMRFEKRINFLMHEVPKGLIKKIKWQMVLKRYLKD